MIKSLAICALLGISHAALSHIRIETSDPTTSPYSHTDDVIDYDKITIEKVYFESDSVVKTFWDKR